MRRLYTIILNSFLTKDPALSMWDIDRRLNLTDIEESATLLKNAPWGVPTHSAQGDVTLLPHEDYVTGWSHDLLMPLFSTYNLDKVVI